MKPYQSNSKSVTSPCPSSRRASSTAQPAMVKKRMSESEVVWFRRFLVVRMIDLIWVFGGLGREQEQEGYLEVKVIRTWRSSVVSPRSRNRKWLALQGAGVEGPRGAGPPQRKGGNWPPLTQASFMKFFRNLVRSCRDSIVSSMNVAPAHRLSNWLAFHRNEVIIFLK